MMDYRNTMVWLRMRLRTVLRYVPTGLPTIGGKRISQSLIMIVCGAIIMWLLCYPTTPKTARPRTYVPYYRGTVQKTTIPSDSIWPFSAPKTIIKRTIPDIPDFPDPDSPLYAHQYPSRKAYFFSFASGEFLPALIRITNEAKSTGAFDEVFAYTPEDMDDEYVLAHSDVLNSTRGRGYWLWKPYFLAKIFGRMQFGDIVMYADSGCEFIGSPEHYIDLAQRYGFVGFKLPGSKHMVSKWTKGDIFDAVGLDMETYGSERQHVGGIWLFQKRPRLERFVSDWLHLCEDYQLVSDAPSQTPNHPDFQENRHDQAIYSLLIYKYGLGIVLEDRTFPRELAPIIHAARRRD
jgi:hypothetical protein